MKDATLAMIQKPFWGMSVAETFAALETRREGLSDEEALVRLRGYGANTIQERSRFSFLPILGRQFKSPLILILIAAGTATFFLNEWIETAVIGAAVLVNTALGFYQEARAERALALLNTYLLTRARVTRGGREKEIDAAELMPGDIIRITQGDRVPADARMLFSNAMEVDESALTGESMPQAKDAEPLSTATVLPDRKNMLFRGTLVLQGFGDAVVTATGRHTEFGKIAASLASREREATPLQRAIARFSTGAGIFLGVLVLLLFVIGIASGRDLFEMFLIAVAVAVSAVPEGLPVALTVTMAIGVERLARRKGIIRRLLAAETLGSTSIILTDKTGTLTQAKMEIAAVEPYAADTGEARRALLRDALMNTDTVIENPGDPVVEWRIMGRALETALVKGAARMGTLVTDFEAARDRLPFHSGYKFSGALFAGERGERVALLGAPEMLLPVTSVSRDEQERIRAEVDRRAREGERVLGVAAADISAGDIVSLRERRFPVLHWQGIISFRDPLRPRVGDAVRRIRDAGVKTVIVTGDHQGTAEAVARALGLIDGAGAVLTGEDLAHLTREELVSRAPDVSVYARVTPGEKLMLVKLYQERGEVVAVTGDGINDAPALAAADIGVAMGSGTEVAKGAADLVILDDDFRTIVAAIEEGRRVLDNIRKVIVYLLSDALDELLLIGGALLMGLALPLNALQILFVNFFSDSFPAIALAFEEGVDGLGERPRKLNRNLFDRAMRFQIFVIGASTSLLLFVLYYILLRAGFPLPLVQTFIFASFATYTLFLAFSMRSLEKSILSYNPFSNLYLVAGVGIGLTLTLAVIYVPLLQRVFQTTPLPSSWLLGVAGMGVVNIAAVELGKWLFRRRVL